MGGGGVGRDAASPSSWRSLHAIRCCARGRRRGGSADDLALELRAQNRADGTKSLRAVCKMCRAAADGDRRPGADGRRSSAPRGAGAAAAPPPRGGGGVGALPECVRVPGGGDGGRRRAVGGCAWRTRCRLLPLPAGARARASRRWPCCSRRWSSSAGRSSRWRRCTRLPEAAVAPFEAAWLAQGRPRGAARAGRRARERVARRRAAAARPHARAAPAAAPPLITRARARGRAPSWKATPPRPRPRKRCRSCATRSTSPPPKPTPAADADADADADAAPARAAPKDRRRCRRRCRRRRRRRSARRLRRRRRRRRGAVGGARAPLAACARATERSGRGAAAGAAALDGRLAVLAPDVRRALEVAAALVAALTACASWPARQRRARGGGASSRCWPMRCCPSSLRCGSSSRAAPGCRGP